MSKPMFSIVIPTRQRHNTLASSIASVLQQDWDDYELVVQDNCSSDDTRRVVQRFSSEKIKYNRAPSVLPMNENWEAALGLCSGEWIFYLGDDDGLMPDGMSLAASILKRAPFEVLMWEKYTYWWEDALEPSVAGRMFLHLGHEFKVLDPRSILKSYYDWELGFGALPSVYTGFVHRSLIDRVTARLGKYFYVGAPDNFTGIANAYFAQSLGKFDRGLSIGGNSGESTGCSYFFRSKGQKRRAAYHSEEAKEIGEIIHPSLIPSVNLEIGQADMQLRAKELLFPGDTNYQIPMEKVLYAIAANANRDPESYDETLADMRMLAAKVGADVSRLQIPPRAVGERPRLQGLIHNAKGEPQALAVNCGAADVHDVAGAARLASALLPTLTIN